MRRCAIDVDGLPDTFPHALHCLLGDGLLASANDEEIHSRWNSMQQRVIRMRFVQDQKYLKLILEDNGQDVTDEKLSEIQDTLSRLVPINECSGLVNINQRIRLYYHTESGPSVSRSTLSGFCVTLMMTKGGGHV